MKKGYLERVKEWIAACLNPELDAPADPGEAAFLNAKNVQGKSLTTETIGFAWYEDAERHRLRVLESLKDAAAASTLPHGPRLSVSGQGPPLREGRQDRLRTAFSEVCSLVKCLASGMLCKLCEHYTQTRNNKGYSRVG